MKFGNEENIKYHVLFVVENNQVPQDTRVWLEARALEEKGFDVSVICPNIKRESESHKILDNIDIFQYKSYFEGATIFGLIFEYLLSSFFIFLYAIKIYLRQPFHIVHLANPPDFIIMIFIFFKLLGVKIVFDHHDLSPEYFLEKFKKRNPFYKTLLLFEKLSYKCANVVIVTNKSFKEVGIERNKIDKKKIFIVRNGPDLSVAYPYSSKIDFRKEKKYLIGYVGKIDGQDCLIKLVNTIEYIVNNKGFSDFRVLIVGDGTDRIRIENIISDRKLEDYFIFYGWEYDKEKLYKILSSFDLCVDTQKESEVLDKSTSFKIMEYMALGKPIVQYKSIEGKYSAQEASLYIENNDEYAFGDAIIYLLNNEKKRKEMGEYGIKRVREFFQWDIQRKILLRIYREVII